MKVKLLVPMTGAKSWAAGDDFECSEGEAKRMIESGIAVAIAAPKVEKAAKKAVAETREG